MPTPSIHLATTKAKLTAILRRGGYPPSVINSIIAEVVDGETRAEVYQEGKNWGRVLRPLLSQIKSLQSSQYRWRKDPQRAEVYGHYLTALIKTRDKIESARTLCAPLDMTIPEVARKYNLTNNGMRWADWVPLNVKTAFEVAFDHLYSVTIPDARTDPETGEPGHAKGKRLVPWRSHYERTASGSRWRNLLVRLITERAGRIVEGPDSPLVQAMTKAIEAVKHRTREQEAPVKWEHLLPVEDQRALEQWRIDTLNGLTTMDAQAVANSNLHKKMEQERARKEAKATLRRAKAAQAARERRAFAKQDRAGG